MNSLLAPAWQVLQALVSWSMATVNLANRLVKFLDCWTDDGLDHVGDRNAVVARKLPLGVLQTFLDLVNLIGSELPVVHFAGEPQLGVAKLCRVMNSPRPAA